MKTKIYYIHKDRFERRPPVISAVMILTELGYDVTVIDEGVSDRWKSVFTSKNIKYFEIPKKGNVGLIGKIWEYYRFRKRVCSTLKGCDDNFIWVEGAPAILSLGTEINRFNHILQIQELHEQSKKQLRAIRKVIGSAKAVFMPEYNRSVLYQVWFKLKNRPIVLPNKPYFVPGKDELESLKEKYKKDVSRIGNKKVVLYQGYIGYDRDISAIVKAVKQMGTDFVTVVVGKDCGVLSEYRKIDPNIVHIDFLPAPDYLLFASMAYIGVLTYVPDCVNNIFCAPNKIYEYGSFGLPMIGNDIPGLKTLEYENAGVVVDVNDEDRVLAAIRKIDANYSVYSKSAKALYDKTDNMETIKKALE